MRKQIKDILASHGLYNKFTIRTVDFSDLARASATVVTIKDWKLNHIADIIEHQINVNTGAIVMFE